LPAERIVVDERALMAINYTSGPPAIPRESCTTPRGLSPVGGNGAPHCVAARQFLPCCAVAVLILGLECERGVGEHRAVAEHREHPALALGPVILIADPADDRSGDDRPALRRGERCMRSRRPRSRRPGTSAWSSRIAGGGVDGGPGVLLDRGDCRFHRGVHRRGDREPRRREWRRGIPPRCSTQHPSRRR
jgi:hypothetical protein